MASNLDTLVTVFGGSGFLGRHVVRALAKRDYRIRVAVRRPELAGHLQPLGRVGQIHAVQANLRYPASVEAAMRDSDAAINLVGILAESGAQSFEAVQAAGAGAVARRGRRRRARGWCMSPRSARTRIRPRATPAPRRPAKRRCWRPSPTATILRPSLVFGPEDQFTNRFAALARISPALPLIGGGADETAAGLCRRCRDRRRRRRRRQDQARRDLRARRPGSADHARDHGDHPRHHRAPAHAGRRCRSAWRSCRRCSCSSRRAP